NFEVDIALPFCKDLAAAENNPETVSKGLAGLDSQQLVCFSVIGSSFRVSDNDTACPGALNHCSRDFSGISARLVVIAILGSGSHTRCCQQIAGHCQVNERSA